MPLAPGTRLGPFEVVGALGAGGMGEVYRARDTKLNRDVALKILPETFAADPERLARFRREAQVLASLNHPAIGHIYGFEDDDSRHALVLELVEGPTLAERIDQGPIPLSEALPIARQIADALEAAHEQGIVHRDLKPANIKVRDDGTAKVLDFGLAKALTAEAGPSSDAMSSPTLTARATQLGVILGTAAYMAPEQAKGRPVDKRADIWAFGVVLYEMLTGHRLFDAEDVSDTLAAVLTRDVTTASLPDALPARLRALVRDCLVRDPRQRLRDIGDARIAIDKLIGGAADDIAPIAASPAPVTSRARAIVWPALAVAGIAAAAILGATLWTRDPPAAESLRFTLSLPPGTNLSSPTIRLSPDGSRLAYAAAMPGSKTGIIVHDFRSGTAHLIPATEGTTVPMFAWSPQGDAIAFMLDGRLRRAALQGGPSQVITTLPAGMQWTWVWGPDDVILLAPSNPRAKSPIMRVAATGGTAEPVTELDTSKKEQTHRHPSFLPDGRRFFFLASPADGVPEVFIGSLDSKDRRPVPGLVSPVWYSPTGHVLFVREGALMAQPFDLTRLELGGSAFVVADAIAPQPALTGPFSVATNGSTLAYRAFSRDTSQLTWIDRAGKTLAKAGPPGLYGDIELSLDDRYVAYEAGLPGDIWVLDLQNGVTQRVTSDAARDADPVWSPDGKRVAFRADRDGGRLYAREVGVVSEDTPLLRSETHDSPAAWSRDNKYLAYETQNNIWALPLSGDPKPIRITQVPSGSAGDAQISPDGRWIAYRSSELGRPEVFIQSFPHPGARQRVSPNSGHTPRWSHDGKELFYLSSDGAITVVVVNTSGGTLSVGPPAALFSVDMTGNSESDYAVSSTGRFLVNVPTAESVDAGITVILNWAGGVRR